MTRPCKGRLRRRRGISRSGVRKIERRILAMPAPRWEPTGKWGEG